MKQFKDILLEKLKITKNTGEFKITEITSADPIDLIVMIGNIPFHRFDYENYIDNVLDTDIIISPKKLKDELNYSKSTLRDCLTKFLNIILTIMNTSKSDYVKYNLQQFIKSINKSFVKKELVIEINYTYLGVDSEKYILIFKLKDYDFNAGNILNIEISK